MKLNYNIFIYKKKDTVSKLIKKNGNFEPFVLSNILNALKHYGKKNNIINFYSFNRNIPNIYQEYFHKMQIS